MKNYVLRRLLQMIPILIGVSLLIFMLIQLAPGDPLSGKIDPRMSLQAKQELRKQYGLDKGPLVQYGIWIKNAIKGDWGESYYYKKSVGKVMNTYIWNSFKLSIVSFVLAIIISIPIGVVSATKQYSGFDYFFTIFALFGISMPSFFFGELLMKWLAVDAHIFPVAGMYTAGSKALGMARFLDGTKHMALPLIVLTLGSLAGFMRYTRSSMLEVIRQDYVRTARAKGLKEKVVIYKHALRNGLIPVITLFGFWLPGLFSGAIVTESIFGWPGIGPVELNAVNGRDYPLLMGINMMLALLVLLGNLLADVIYAAVDPRIRYK